MIDYQNGDDDGHRSQFERFENLKKLFIEHYKKDAKNEMVDKPKMDDNFNMALYISLNLDRILEDFYSFHISSWIFVLAIKAGECIAMGATVGTGHWEWYDKLVVSLIVSSFSPAVLTWAIAFGKSNEKMALETGHFRTSGGMFGLADKYDVEMWLTRSYQALAFTLSYELMRQVANKGLWEQYDIADWPMNKGWATFISVGTIAVLWLVNIWLLPRAIMQTVTKYALPPYVDEENMSIIHAVIAVSGPKENLDKDLAGSGAEADGLNFRAEVDGADPAKLSISVGNGETKEENEPNNSEHEPQARVGLSNELTGENGLTERRLCGTC